jgi:hypothetical protein
MNGFFVAVRYVKNFFFFFVWGIFAFLDVDANSKSGDGNLLIQFNPDPYPQHSLQGIHHI